MSRRGGRTLKCGIATGPVTHRWCRSHATAAVPGGGGSEFTDHRPEEDTHIVSGAPDSNFGSSSVLQVGNDAADGAHCALMDFQVESFFKEPMDVQKASLKMHAEAAPSSAVDVAVHSLNVGWEWDQATWNDRLTSTPWGTAGGDFDATSLDVTPVDASGWLEWETGPRVQDWLDSGANQGLAVKAADEAGTGEVINFVGAAHDTLEPRIEISWRPAPDVISG